MSRDKEILVCSACRTAACWYGEFMCDEARRAGLVRMTVGDLRMLNREHSEYWTNTKFLEVYGTDRPDFSHERKAGLPDALR